MVRGVSCWRLRRIRHAWGLRREGRRCLASASTIRLVMTAVAAMAVIRRISLRRRRSIGGGVVCLRGSSVVVRRGAAVSAV